MPTNYRFSFAGAAADNSRPDFPAIPAQLAPSSVVASSATRPYYAAVPLSTVHGLDGTLCAALMTALPAVAADGRTARARTTNLKAIAHWHARPGRHAKANRFLAPLLDSLATVAVSRANGESYAVALRLSGSEVELVISGSEGVPPETAAFLHWVWSELIELSELAAANKYGSEPPPAEVHRQNGFYQSVFCFAMPKFRQQFAKYRGRLSEVLDAHQEWMEDQEDGFVDPMPCATIDALQSMFEVLDECQSDLEDMDECPDDDELLGSLVNFMGHANAVSRCILSSSTDCAPRGSRANEFAETVNLRRSIGRISSFFEHVAKLVEVACAAKFAGIFQRHFVVTTVPAASSLPLMPIWPSDPYTIQWAEVRDTLYKLAGYEPIAVDSATDAAIDSDGDTDVDSGTTGTTGTTAGTRAPLQRGKTPAATEFEFATAAAATAAADGCGAHCEVALILYLDAHPGTRTFNYIGVSNRPCKACFLWMEAHNACSWWRPLYTGGAQDRWCVGWVMPKCPRAIRRRFVRLLAAEYSAEKERRGEARARGLL